MMSRLKDTLYSERGMKIVNLLFYAANMLRLPIMLFVNAAWLLYLIGGIERSPSKGSKAIYAILAVIPVVSMVMNVSAFIGS